MAEEDESERLAARQEFLRPPDDSTPARTTDLSSGSPSAPSPSMPERIGPYRILRKLGQGGMGVVYAAQDERLDRTLAISDPWLDPFRATPAFRAILAEAEEGRKRALAVFREAGGEGLLEVKPA